MDIASCNSCTVIHHFLLSTLFHVTFSLDIAPTLPPQQPGHCPKEDDDSPFRWIPYKDSCYAFVTEMKPWSRAARLCMTWGKVIDWFLKAVYLITWQVQSTKSNKVCTSFSFSLGSSLVSIRDEAEEKFIDANLVLLESYKDFWIGLFHTQKGNALNITTRM